VAKTIDDGNPTLSSIFKIMLSKIAMSFLMFNYAFVFVAFLIEKNWGWSGYWLGVIISMISLSIFGIKQIH
jgi:hypothetical protein